MKERNSPEGSDTELLSNGHHVIVLSDGNISGTALGGNLGVSAALTPAQKWAFLATNIPYALVAAQIFAEPSIREDAVMEPLADGCASPLFHGAIVGGLCVVSTVWHAAQCQVASLLCGAAPFLPPVLKSLLVGDVLCSLLAVCVGLFCFRGRTAAWLALPFLSFLYARRCKRQSNFPRYAFWHSAWHCLSAFAIWNIVLWPVGL